MQKSEPCQESLPQANRSPLNTSKAKAMFSFTKEERFPLSPLNASPQFYEKQSMLNKRAPSFGYGQKMDIALKNTSPSPDKYTMGSEFTKGPKSGLTIGHGREDCKSISIFTQSRNPGPGEYNLQREKENIKDVTMSPKLKFPSLWSSNNAPGPGAYEIQKVDNFGLCITSKYKSKNSFKIPTRSPEKENQLAESIGPGSYNTNLSSTGKQILARNKTEKSFVFPKKVRETMDENTLSPGPGAYKHYSIFGLL